MAGDWIKMRTIFPRDGRVSLIRRQIVAKQATGVATICGALYLLWTLADEIGEVLEGGDALLSGYAESDLDAFVGIEGFTKALPECWMVVTPSGLLLPNYVEHNGTTAKKRAQDQKRQKKRRQSVAKASRKRRGSVANNSTKRREEVQSHVPPVSPANENVQRIPNESGSGSITEGTFDFVKSVNEKTGRTGLPQRPQLLAVEGLLGTKGWDWCEGIVEGASEQIAKARGSWAYIVKVLQNAVEGGEDPGGLACPSCGVVGKRTGKETAEGKPVWECTNEECDYLEYFDPEL